MVRRMNCAHGMPSPASCIDCMDEGPVVALARQRPLIARSIAARFDGRCDHCRSRIDEGDPLHLVEVWGWVCGECAR